MKIKGTSKLLAAVVALAMSHSASAGLMNLVTNGEFDDTARNPGRWTATDVTGWESSEGRIEIWNPGFKWGNRMGSDGKSTGQHAEITWRHDQASIWTTFVIPQWFGGSGAQFRFDYQNRRSRGLWASVLINGQEKEKFSVSSRNSWSLLDENISGISAGDEVMLSFKSNKGGSSGAHIDQVEFLIEDTQSLQLLNTSADVPVPGTAALLALGSLVMGSRRRVAKA